VRIKLPDGGFERRAIDGLWELPVEGMAQQELEAIYSSARHYPSAKRSDVKGAIVRRDGMLCELPTERNSYDVVSSWPQSTQIVILRADAQRLATAIKQQVQTKRPAEVRTRERETLLTIIAALATDLGYLETPSKSAGVLEQTTLRLGHRVAERTIAAHLSAAKELVRLQAAGPLRPKAAPPSRKQGSEHVIMAITNPSHGYDVRTPSYQAAKPSMARRRLVLS